MRKYSINELKIQHTNLFYEALEEARRFYNALMADLSTGNEKDINWWASEVASRNPYSAPLFEDCCDFIFTQKIISKILGEKLIVRSVFMKKAVEQYCKENQIKLKVSSKSTFIEKTKYLIWPVPRYFKLILIYMGYWVASKIVFQKNNEILKDNILVNTYVHDDSFEKIGAAFKDRYYRNFGNLLTPQEQRKVYYAPTFVNVNTPLSAVKIMRAIRACPEQFLLKEDFLKITDYLFAFLSPFRVIRFFFKKAYLDGVEITPLFRRSLWHSIISYGTIEALLKYRFIRRLQEKKTSVRLVIEWFENQNVQKITSSGFRHYFPGVEIIGYQGYFPSKNYMCCFPTNIEYKNNLLPHTVAVGGGGLKDGPKEFCSMLNVSLAPALRFMDLQKKRCSYPNENNFTIFVALPGCMVEAIFILQCLAALQDLKIENLKTVIKTHPITTRNDLITLHKLSPKFNQVELLTSGNYIELTDQSDVVISGKSNACIEAIARGVPAIIVYPKGTLSRNLIPLTISSIIWRACSSADEIGIALQYFYASKDINKLKYEGIAFETKKQYFEPVTRRSISEFLKLYDTKIEE